MTVTLDALSRSGHSADYDGKRCRTIDGEAVETGALSTDEAKSLVVRTNSYISRLIFRKLTRWKDEEIAAIQAEAHGSCIEFGHGGSKKKALNELEVRLPKLAAAAAAPPHAAFVIAAEITLEVSTASVEQAQRLKNYMASHAMWDTRPTDDGGIVRFGVEAGGNGRYSTLRVAKQGAASREPCCLISVGERGSFDPNTKQELTSLNHEQFWAMRLRLWEIPDAITVGARMRRLASPSKTVLITGNEDGLGELGRLVLAASVLQGEVHASELLRTLRVEAERDGFRRIDSDWLSPPQGNAL